MTIKYIKEVSKDGIDILKVINDGKECYLGSYYNQQKEISKTFKQFSDFKSNDTYIILGLGNGETLRELLKRRISKNNVLIIEYNDEWIKEFKENNRIFNYDNILITSNEEEIINFIRKIPSNIVSNIKFINTFNYEKILNKKLVKTMKNIKFEIAKLVIDRNTNISLGEDWFESTISNLIYGNSAMEINNLENKFKGVPAIIVSAGPSLSKNIDYIKEYIGKGLIITGGRTLRPLLEKGIKPDLIGIIDASQASYELVEENLNDYKIPLIFNELTNKEIVKKHKGKKIVVSDNILYGELWEKEFPILNLGGSVAHFITAAAIYLGCNPIIFVGQDLAYTNNKGHSEIAYNIKDKNKSTDITRYKNINDIFIEDINGNKVRTSLSLNDFRVSFENIISTYKNTQFINATEGGANIKGAENKKLKNVIESLPNVNTINFDELIINKDKNEKLTIVIDDLFNEFERIIEIASKANKELELLKVKFKNGDDIQNILNKLDKLDSNLKKNTLALGFIKDYIYSELYNIEVKDEFTINEEDSDFEVFNKIYLKNKAIYRSIIRCLKKSQDEIKNKIKEYEEFRC